MKPIPGNRMCRAFICRLALCSLLLLFVLLPPALASGAQPRENRTRLIEGYASIAGSVVDAETGEPLEFAAITLIEYNMSCISCEQGRFFFNNVPLGVVNIHFQRLGMEPLVQILDLPESKIYEMEFTMEATSLSLAEFTVTARESRSGASTSSSISRSAIEHLQATNLTDILQLLPGHLAENPDLMNPGQITLRQVHPDAVNAAGTAILMDGVPVSNNANLQIESTALSRHTNAFSTVAGGGIDTRQISTDNIESIEVIRGIPSVQHGDLTSGAVIVQTRAGRTPWEFKTRINPNSSVFSFGKGVDFGRQRGSMNLDLDYARSTGDPRFVFEGFDRLTGQLTYSRTLFRQRPLNTTTRLSFFSSLDQTRNDPDDTRTHSSRSSSDRGFRLNTSGRVNLEHPLSTNLRYNLSLSYAHQVGTFENMISGSAYPLSVSMSDTLVPASFIPAEYMTSYTVDGRPVNLFFKLTNSFITEFLGGRHLFVMGFDWRSDGNTGKGYVYDMMRPPRLDMSGTRPRAYGDIPFLHQYALFAEDNVSGNLFGRRFNLQLGLRFDHIQPASFDIRVLSPRINLMYSLTPTLDLRGGYGVTAKSPGLMHLYPNDAYFDLISLNYYAAEPSERLVLMSTRVFPTQNGDLDVSRNKKAELGADLRLWERRFSFTLFDEYLSGGLGIQNIYVPITFPRWLNDDLVVRPGQTPYYNPDQPSRTDTFFVNLRTPHNLNVQHNRGIEFDFDLGRFEAINTSLYANGAWIWSERSSGEFDYYLHTTGSITQPERVGIYQAGTRGRRDERFSSVLRAVHNIPELQFVVSLTVQTTWISKNDHLRVREYPVGYINRMGEQVMISPEQARSPEYADLVVPVNPNLLNQERWPPLWLFNLRLSKNISQDIGFAFFVNNVFSNQPMHRSTRFGGYAQRNPSLFFGTELSVKL